MSKLPNVYKCEINKEIKNNKEYCLLENEEQHDASKDLESIINSLGPIYLKKVLIKTPIREIETYIYKVKKDYIITKELEIIKIKDIVSIKRIS